MLTLLGDYVTLKKWVEAAKFPTNRDHPLMVVLQWRMQSPGLSIQKPSENSKSSLSYADADI